LSHLPLEAVVSRAAAMPPHSAIFFGIMMVDAAGTHWNPAEAITAILSSASAPVFALQESFFGLGTVGGRLMPERAGGVQAAVVALRILQGESPADIPVAATPFAPPRFDWRVLQRWRISESRLPRGSVISFQQPSLFRLYPWHFITGSSVLALQTFLITRLLIQRRRRRRAENELARSEERLRLITNALPVLIAYVDAELCYQFNNDAYQEWFGIDPESARGRNIREVIGELNFTAVSPYIGQVLAGKTVRFNQELNLRDGRAAVADVHYVPEIDEQGLLHGFYILALDVTERSRAQQEAKLLQSELSQAGRISSMGELAGALAHEINQPLSAIMSNAQAAKRFLEAPQQDLEEIRDILDDIIKEDARAGSIIARLRGFLKKSPAHFELLDLNGVIQEVIDLLHSEAVISNIELKTELDLRLPPILGDRIELQQVVMNLLLNAFEAVCALAGGNRQVAIRSRLNGNEVQAVVSDNGIGLAGLEPQQLFKPFFTTKAQGLGMGLAISRTIITRHGGQIRSEESAEGGAAFRVTLPIPGGNVAQDAA
jgi:PAS domain S-box-containing protein